MSNTKNYKSHKIRLQPTKAQKEHLQRAFSAARYAWNFGKEIIDAEYDISRVQYRDTLTKYTSINIQYDLKKLYRRVKPDWAYNVGSVDDSVFEDLRRAIDKYFAIQKGKIAPPQGMSLKEANDKRFRRDGKKAGWPKWRSRKRYNSFRQTNTSLKVKDKKICYNKKVGWIKTSEKLRFDGKIANATFSYDGKWYWASVQVEVEPKKEAPAIAIENNTVGVDLGIKYLASRSDYKNHPNPRAYYQKQSRRRRLQRKLDRQRRANNPDCYNPDGTNIKGKRPDKKSGQMNRTEEKIRKIDDWIKNTRRNAQHHLTKEITQFHDIVVLEDLNVKGMLKNRKLSKAIQDAAFGEIRRQFEYKAVAVEIVDRWFPSSKLCSGCNEKNFNLELKDRYWICENCGQHNERDLNAAINLRDEGIRLYNNGP